MKKVFLIFVMVVFMLNISNAAKSIFSLDIVIPTLNDVTGRFDAIISFQDLTSLKYGFDAGFSFPFIKYYLYDLKGTFDFSTLIDTIDYQTKFAIMGTFGKREASIIIEQPISSNLDFSTKYGIKFFLENLGGYVIIETTLKELYIGFTY
ncbi:hypothetical protein SAMN02745164_00332 [Marinitoga hydrogenitolerans DSM 16785]|uniref:Uncharacterized protein n=1 Tax=Marinitoga hydrogenitolerans (strain DSM 16785 / JCM 12826 / AT1271) TaxID=1122195 RepID=A0A1M4T191_MARH1|nr:hypothetical protein [Marinitoga hydrogenitolerans]SHE38189.1 hypothetical protein SAMN02745164_00332 [Marinitoga hydrogenitolerans DSM 16785]